jgi:hypothetical protein
LSVENDDLSVLAVAGALEVPGRVGVRGGLVRDDRRHAGVDLLVLRRLGEDVPLPGRAALRAFATWVAVIGHPSCRSRPDLRSVTNRIRASCIAVVR